MKLAGATRRLGGFLALVTVTAAACSSPTDADPVQVLEADAIEARIGSGIVFIRMTVVQDMSMNALAQDRLVADEQGCLRLETGDRHTVVWPHGYDFDPADGETRIFDANGELIGRVGEDFRLGGGEVTSLHEGLGFTDADRELAEAQCPGRYWIVGTD